jgi:adenylate cyclase
LTATNRACTLTLTNNEGLNEKALTERSMTDSAVTEDASQVRTFLIADVRGYTRFTLEHGDAAAAKLATQFAKVTSESVDAHEGQVTELRGDEALAVFSSARQALRASVDLQDRFEMQSRKSSLPLKVGIGLDSGEAIPVAGGYRGAALNLAARLCALAGPGEVLASGTVANLARKLEGITYLERGLVELKGFADLVRIVQVPSAADEAQSPYPRQATEPAESVPIHQRLPIGGFLGSLPFPPLH